MEKKSFNREWVKTAAIIFLAVLLGLTFFSNTILNASLTEVSVAEVGSDSITAKVKGSGTVSSKGQTEVKASNTRYIAEVNAKEGKEVEAGDVLFTLGAGDSEELASAKDQLESLNDSLIRSYSYISDANLNSAANAITRAQEDLERALSAEDQAKNKLYSLAVGDEEAAAAENRLKQAENNLAIVIKNWAPSLSEAEVTFNEATKAANDYYTGTYSPAKADYDAKLAKYNEMASNPDVFTPSEIAQAKQDADDAGINLASISADYTQYMDDVEAARQAYEHVQTVANAAEDDAQSELTDAKSAYNAIMGSYNSAYTDYENAQAATRKAESALESANESFYSATESYNSQATNNANSTAVIQRQIERQKQKVADLEGEAGTTINAPIGGTIKSISVSPGSKTTKNQVLCVIEVPDMGYELSYSVTNDQAKRIKVGNPATVLNYNWGSDITATVSKIATDKKNPQTNKTITFSLEGDDITVGSQLTVAVGEKSATYDFVVPNSAIRTDSNGTFVLVVTSKNNALGNRYFASRVAAEVLASDDNNSAINGNFSNGDFVITTSSAPVKSGDQVRMADTNDK